MMKGFKHTGKGPKYGNFNFSTKAGFSASSGKVKHVGGYTRRTPVKKSIGGLASSAPFKGTNQGFSEGGVARKTTGAAITPSEAKILAKKSTGAQMTPKEARKMASATKGKFQ